MKKVAVITGASSGIGKATALILAANNYDVVLLARRADKLKEVERELVKYNVKVLVRECDVTKVVQVHNAIEQVRKVLGKIDVLINCAGYGVYGALENMSLTDINGQMMTNYFGTVLMIKECLADLKKTQGSIVNVASVSGLIGFGNMSAYTATKFAVVGLSESLYLELLPEKVAVSCVCPGKVKTDLFKQESWKNVDWAQDSSGILPSVVAKEIYRAIKERKFLYVVPKTTKWELFLKEIVPKFIVNKIMGKM